MGTGDTWGSPGKGLDKYQAGYRGRAGTGLSGGAQGVTGMGVEKHQGEHWDGTGDIGMGCNREDTRVQQNGTRGAAGRDGGAPGQAGESTGMGPGGRCRIISLGPGSSRMG